MYDLQYKMIILYTKLHAVELKPYLHLDYSVVAY